MLSDACSAAHSTLDVSGAVDPGPVLSVSRRFGTLEDGQTLYVVSDCSGTADDLRAWARGTGNALLQVDNLGRGRSGCLLRKGASWSVARTVETTGARCPVPILKLARGLASVHRGAVVKLVSDCTSAEAEVESWTQATGHDLLAGAQTEDGTWSFYVRKAGRAKA